MLGDPKRLCVYHYVGSYRAKLRWWQTEETGWRRRSVHGFDIVLVVLYMNVYWCEVWCNRKTKTWRQTHNGSTPPVYERRSPTVHCLVHSKEWVSHHANQALVCGGHKLVVFSGAFPGSFIRFSLFFLALWYEWMKTAINIECHKASRAVSWFPPYHSYGVSDGLSIVQLVWCRMVKIKLSLPMSWRLTGEQRFYS
jgi:hypothetical protein